MPESIKEHIKRAKDLMSRRSVWHTHWDELARVLLPRREGFASTHVEGSSRTENIYDGTPLMAARGLANAIGGIVRPEGQKWFFVKSADDEIDEQEEAKEWFAEVERRIRSAFDDPRSRFRQATGECDMDLVVFGTGVLYEGENNRLDSLLFQSVHLKDAVVYFDDEGIARGVYRFAQFTLRQAEGKWGADALSSKSKEKLAQNKGDEKADFLHCVVPRAGGKADAYLAKNMPFTDTWIEIEQEHLISDRGFHDFPFVVPRWDTSSGEEYGRSPGMIALPDSMTLQAMGETILIAGQRAADPPLAVPADGVFSEYNTYPGGLLYYDPTTAGGKNPFFEVGQGGNIPLTREMQQDYREQVFAAFFRNVLQLPVQGPQMTATEVIQRKEEFIREIGPVFGRLETDYTAPMVERAFKILLRTGRLPEVPPVLAGSSVHFTYESPVKRVRQQIESQAAEMWLSGLVAIAANTGDPAVLDVVDFDKYARLGAEAAGLEHDMLLPESAVQEKRDARAQAQAEAAKMAQYQAMADIAKTGAGAVKDATTRGPMTIPEPGQEQMMPA